MDGEPVENPTLFPIRAGERLREARLAQNLELSEVAARTRIPQRHLEAIEDSNYAGLPSITYVVGFAKAYARAIGADEVAIAQTLRGELAQNYERKEPREVYNTEDPPRVPSSGVALAGVFVMLLVLVGVGIWFGTDWFRGSATPAAPVITEEVPVAVETAVPAPVPGGQVTLIATDEVWLRIYDATGKSLFEKTMQPGERYDVPADADRPMINVGRPETLQVTLNGSNVAPLGRPGIAIKDVGVSAEALLARGTAPATDAAATPAPTATGTVRTSRPAASSSRTVARPTPSEPEPTPSDGNIL
jgi:transcriptional regulator with XRE-family HTH domain